MNENVPVAGPRSTRRALLTLLIIAGLIAAYMALGSILDIASLSSRVSFSCSTGPASAKPSSRPRCSAGGAGSFSPF
jgi:hypothetical protein